MRDPSLSIRFLLSLSKAKSFPAKPLSSAAGHDDAILKGLLAKDLIVSGPPVAAAIVSVRASTKLLAVGQIYKTKGMFLPFYRKNVTEIEI
jgi:hypothetical protein